MHTKQELDERLKAAGIRPLKSLGQNFLLNPRISQTLIGAVAKLNPATVVEIGPGLGALTDELREGKWKTVLIELDSGLVEYWKKRAPELEIIHKDALQIDWAKLNWTAPVVLTSNLPYSIAASLVVELSSMEQNYFGGLVLMFQKEVAERIAAQPDDEDYGMLSVVAQTMWRVEKVIDAGPQDFFPVPHVGSRVLLLTPNNVVFQGPDFLTFVKLAFSQRRKKMVSNLGASYEKEKTGEILLKMGFKTDVRAQELTPTQFVELFSQLNHKKK